jgi:coiled-coil domain-containing protein 12
MTSLLEESKKRKERLRQLRENYEDKELEVEEDKGDKGSKKRLGDSMEGESKLRFRAYEPETVELKQYMAEAPVVGPKANKATVTVESTAEKIKQEIAEEELKQKPELVLYFVIQDLENLAPKKRNWDIKRDLESKLNKLDRDTRIAMADIIRMIWANIGERLKSSGDLSLAVSMSHDQINDD